MYSVYKLNKQGDNIQPWCTPFPIWNQSVVPFQKNIYFCFIDYAKAFDCVDHNKLLKILKEIGIPDHLTCLLRNLYAGQEATVRTGHGTTDLQVRCLQITVSILVIFLICLLVCLAFNLKFSATMVISTLVEKKEIRHLQLLHFESKCSFNIKEHLDFVSIMKCGYYLLQVHKEIDLGIRQHFFQGKWVISCRCR